MTAPVRVPHSPRGYGPARKPRPKGEEPTCPVCLKPIRRDGPNGLGKGRGYGWPARDPATYCTERIKHADMLRKWRIEAYGRVFEVPAAELDRRPLRLRLMWVGEREGRG